MKEIKLLHPVSLLIFSLIVGCNYKIENYLKQKQIDISPIRVLINPTKIDIDISFLSSITSRKIQEDRIADEIDYRMDFYSRWFQLQLANYLEENQFRVVGKKEDADLIIDSSIVDLAEIRPKMFIEGLSIGLVFGLIAGELSGDPQVGLGVFLLEVVEEFVILYILKSYFLVSTIETKFYDKDGNLLKDTEFTAYSNKEYIAKLPQEKQSIRENKVKASLDQNAQDIVEFLQKNSTNISPQP